LSSHQVECIYLNKDRIVATIPKTYATNISHNHYTHDLCQEAIRVNHRYLLQYSYLMLVTINASEPHV